MDDFGLRVHRWSRSVSNIMLDDRITVRQRAEKYSEMLLEADSLLGEAVKNAAITHQEGRDDGTA